MTDDRAALAPVYADIVLDNLTRSFPYAAHHVAIDEPDARATPRELHPAFSTSFDWHSCVHMHWLGVSLLEFGLDPARDAALRLELGRTLIAGNITVEVAYLRANPGWERPYGWAWLARLAAVCANSADPEVRRWGAALDPALDAVTDLLGAWVPVTDWPVRHGVHTNAAFGLALLLDAFRSTGRAEAAAVCEEAARRWFAADAGWPHAWERSGQDFLSAGLTEADLMRRVLDGAAFTDWFGAFLPGLEPGSTVLTPADVVDATDGYQVHLHGLNLSRAAQLARIGAALHGSPAGGLLADARGRLLDAGLDAAIAREFMSSHWLASFAWDALTATSAASSATASAAE
ncbi:DUF2891 family protein [Leifsonia sp. NPDC058248]|uniref:DUF2891 family protein n=1 Tax=Leifsonia sp. NPDC058248 TaxID=3346402 RepID=UPI0036D78693